MICVPNFVLDLSRTVGSTDHGVRYPICCICSIVYRVTVDPDYQNFLFVIVANTILIPLKKDFP